MSSPPIQLGGLASGIDTTAVIAALMAVERQPRAQLDIQKAKLQARQGALQDVQTRLNQLKLAADALGSAASWAPTQSATSADPSKVSVSLTGSATPGGYNLSVSQLATGAQATYGYAPPAAAGTVTVNGQAIAVAAGTTIDQLVSTINATQNTNAVAVNVNGNLVIAATKTGASSQATISGAGIGATLSSRAGTDARFSLDGTTWYRSATNTLTAASTVTTDTGAAAQNPLPVGVQVTMNGVTSGTAFTVTAPALDQSAVSQKVKDFVSTYNSTLDYLRAKTSETPVANPRTSLEAGKGALYNDSGLRDLMTSLRSTLGRAIQAIDPANPAATASRNLFEIGISTGATTGGGAYSQDAVNGRLAFDQTAFTAAVNANPQSVQQMLGALAGPGRGLSAALGDVLNPYVRSGGVLDTRIGSVGSDIRDVTGRMAAWDARLAQQETSLRAQFTAMEKAISRSKSQGAYLLSRLGLSATG